MPQQHERYEIWNYPNTIYRGNAILVGTRDGWAIPGRAHTNDKMEAEMIVRKMEKLMGALK